MSVVGEKAKLLFSRGFFHIFGASAVNKAIAFITNIVIVRFLTQDEYGLFSYANSVYTIVAGVTGLGLIAGMFVFGSEKRSADEKRRISRYALTRGLGIDFVLMAALMSVGILYPFPLDQAGPYIVLFAPLLLLSYVFDYLTTMLRMRRENKRFAGLTNLNTILYSGLGCLGALAGGIAGTILGRYAAYVVSIAVGLLVSRGVRFRLKGDSRLSRSVKKELWGFSLKNQAAAALNRMSYSVQMIILAMLLYSAGDLAAYKADSLIPEGLYFVVSSVTMFVAPYVIEHNRDAAWLKRKIPLIFASMGVVNFGISAILFFSAGGLVQAVWGEEYAPAILPMQILALNYFLSGTLRSIAVEVLSMLKETGFNLFLSVAWGVGNIALTFLMVPRWGLAGAALGVVANTLVSSCLSITYLVHVVRKIDRKGKESRESTLQTGGQ